MSFSPRNGEMILKKEYLDPLLAYNTFQSPQWGDNSKEHRFHLYHAANAFQSPQWWT